MKSFNLFNELSKNNCYSLCSKIYGHKPDLGKILNSMTLNCDLYNTKKNTGSLNIKGLAGFLTWCSVEDCELFDNWINKINGESN